MKGPWESRVGMLLEPPYFVWKHKCPDVGPHGGAVKIDWIACDLSGKFTIIEVKWQEAVGTLFHNYKEVTPLQREALTAVDKGGAAFLAVGHGKTAREHPKYISGLYIFRWSDIYHLEDFDLRETDHLFLPWTGETDYKSKGTRLKLWSWLHG